MAGKKINRNKKSINGKAYLAENRAVKNKKMKIARHQKEHINDKQAIGTVPDYASKKSTRYLFGAIQKGVSKTSKRS